MSNRITSEWTATTAQAFGNNHCTQTGDKAEHMVYNYLQATYDAVHWHRQNRSKQIAGKDFEFKKKQWKHWYSVDVKGNMHRGMFLVYVQEIANKQNHRMIHVDTDSGQAVEYDRQSMLEYLHSNPDLVQTDRNNNRYARLKASSQLLPRCINHFRPFKIKLA